MEAGGGLKFPLTPSTPGMRRALTSNGDEDASVELELIRSIFVYKDLLIMNKMMSFFSCVPIVISCAF